MNAEKKRIFVKGLKRIKRPPRRLPKQLYPSRLEARYARTLDQLVKFLKAEIDKKVKPLLPGLVDHFGRDRKDEAPEPEKYYLAFIFEKTIDPDVLHCTHKYLGPITKRERAWVEKTVDSYFQTKELSFPRVSFTRREFFGPDKDVPVLTPEPSLAFSQFEELRALLDTVLLREDEFPFSPHVTTNLPRLDLPFCNYALISKSGILRTWPKTVRKDADDNDLTDLADSIESVRIAFQEEYSQSDLEKLAKITGRSVDEWNAAQMNGQLKAIAGIDLFGEGGEPWLAKEMGAFVTQNVSLIQSIGDEYLGQVEKVVSTYARAGYRVEDLAAELEDRYDVSASRASLIARDQIGKFNGQLTEARQTDLGIEGYVWRDSGDARVRPEHHQLNGTSHTWDDPPAPGHPGEDYQCRCSAEPDLAKFYDEGDNTE